MKADEGASPAVKKAAATAKRPRRAKSLDRAAWIRAARKLLIAEGIDRVKVDLLAKRLKVTIGSFYHHFRTRDDLLGGLLEDWENSNNESIFAAVEAAGDDPMRQFDALWDNWVFSGLYDPAYDSAVRAWAHGSKSVRDRVRLIDDRRVELLKQIFVKLGHDDERAFIRARVAYFHQIGYQALEITESIEDRIRLAPLYDEVLLGRQAGREFGWWDGQKG